MSVYFFIFCTVDAAALRNTVTTGASPPEAGAGPTHQQQQPQQPDSVSAAELYHAPSWRHQALFSSTGRISTGAQSCWTAAASGFTPELDEAQS